MQFGNIRHYTNTTSSTILSSIHFTIANDIYIVHIQCNGISLDIGEINIPRKNKQTTQLKTI